MILGIGIGYIIVSAASLVCGVLFNKPIRLVLQKVPLVGKYF